MTTFHPATNGPVQGSPEEPRACSCDHPPVSTTGDPNGAKVGAAGAGLIGKSEGRGIAPMVASNPASAASSTTGDGAGAAASGAVGAGGAGNGHSSSIPTPVHFDQELSRAAAVPTSRGGRPIFTRLRCSMRASPSFRWMRPGGSSHGTPRQCACLAGARPKCAGCRWRH